MWGLKYLAVVAALLCDITYKCDSEELTCATKENEVEETYRVNECGSSDALADGLLHLLPLEDTWIDKNKLIFIESSGSNILSTRYLCAAESTAVHSGLPVIVLLTSPTLNLTANNATAVLYHKYRDAIHFRHADPLATLRQSPFGEDHAETILARISASETKVVQLSDALRLAVVYRFGGWYADFDTIFMRPLTEFETDVISTDCYFPGEMTTKEDRYGHRILGSQVSNGIFRFAKSGSEFLRRTIVLFVRNFRQNVRSSGGAIILTRVMSSMCEFREEDGERSLLTVERYSAERCQGLQLVDPKLFFPYSWMEAGSLFVPGKSQEDWETFVKDSYSMDFYQSSMTGKDIVLWPKYYGQKLPAYAALAPKFCPLSFFSHRHF